MGRQLAVTVNAVHRVGTKMYLTDSNLTHRKVKKAYLTVGGVHKLCYKSESPVETMTISYTGTMIDAGVVTMTDGEYRLLTLTSSGTLETDLAVSAEFWMCGGGADGKKGGASGGKNGSGYGGAGAYTATGKVSLSGSLSAVVAASNGVSSFCGHTTEQVNGMDGGTGGGLQAVTSPVGTGSRKSKYPFADTNYFKPHCGGGGGGGYYTSAGTYKTNGGSGGTNGSDGGGAVSTSSATSTGGSGGTNGGGRGGSATTSKANAGNSATFYGSGGGGGGYSTSYQVGGGAGGSGYQGVIYIRIPVNQTV